MDKTSGLTILIIEDDADTQVNLRDILELDDHRVVVAATAAEALSRDDWQTISAIILDRKLPDGSADDLLPRLRRVAPAAAVIIVTGYADLQGAVSALRHGANDYILKPIDPDDLRTRLGRIVEAQRTEDELKRQAEIIRSLLENATDATIVVDVQGRVLLYNPAVKRMFGPLKVGTAPEEWSNSGITYQPDAESADPSRRVPLARALCGETIIDEETLIQATVSQPERWMSVNASPIRDDGRIKGAVVIYREITERKRAEKELLRQRDLAEGLIDAAPAIVALLNPEGRIVRFNHFAEELSGYAVEDVLERDFFETLIPAHDQVRVREVFRNTINAVDTSGTVSSILTKSGREREIRWSNRVLKETDSRIVGLLALGQDITDLKEAQERALHAERLAAIGEMVAGLAHESRNALQRSQACLELLALQVHDRPKAIDLIDRLQQAQDHLHHLYEDVRGYAAPIRLERRPCKLAEIWREAWAHLNPRQTGRQTSLVESGTDPDAKCLVDPFRLRQVFRNIFENALAASPDPVTIEVNTSQTLEEGVPSIRIAVRDNGPGLTTEDRERIFEPFYTTKTKGTGLGMAIVRRIIDAHCGKISAGQAAGQGAEILITLPQGNLYS